MQRHIGRIRQMISTQLEAITLLKAAGYSVERAERSLSNAIDLLVTHEVHRAKIEAGLSALRTRKQP